MTTSTQYVRNAADSQRNRSMLCRLSFAWPKKVSHEGPLRRRRLVMGCENSANDVLVDVDTEGQDNLLGNTRASPTWIALHHSTTARIRSVLGPFVPGLVCVLQKTEVGIFDEPERDES